MSVISNRHTVNSFVAGESKPLHGQRLARVGYKSTPENTRKGFKSICVSLPSLQGEFSEEVWKAHEGSFKGIVQRALESAQDGIIKSLYESSGGTLSSVDSDSLGILQCLAYIESEQTGGRLSKEMLEAWFDSTLAENLTVVIADKLGFEELNDSQMGVIEKHLNGYRGLISSLSGNKTILTHGQISGIRRALELSKVEDETVEKLRGRLDQMEKKEKIEDLLEL